MQRVRIVMAAAVIALALALSVTRVDLSSWVAGWRSSGGSAPEEDVDWGGVARGSRASRYLKGRGGGAGQGSQSNPAGDDGLSGKRGKRALSVAGGGARQGGALGDPASRREWRGDSRAWVAGGDDFPLTARDSHADLRSAAGSPPEEHTDRRDDPRDEQPDDGSQDVVFEVPLNRRQGTLAADSTAPITEQNVTYPEKGDGVRFGPDSVLAFPNAGNLRGDEGTLSLEIQPEWDGDDEGDFSLMNVRTPNDPSNMLRVYKNGRYLRYIFADDAGQEHEVGFDMAQWEAGDRHSVTVTWGDSSTALYVDRRLVGQNSYEGRLQIPFGTPLYVGSDVPEAPPTGAGGVISNLRVYGKALTGEVIAAAR